MGAGWIVAVLLAVGVLAGCGRSDPHAQATPEGAGWTALRQAGHALVARGEYQSAVGRYREALQQAPDDLPTHYALAVALSYLDRRDEAAEEFRWVVAHGAAGEPEVRTAAEWLRAAGLLTRAPRSAAPTDAAGAAPADVYEPVGGLRGATVWPGVSPEARPLQLQILLQGDDSFNRGRLVQGRTRLGAPYSLPRVPAGSYRLMAQVGAVRLWDTRVTVAPDRELVLDLTPASSSVSPSEFPPPADR